MSVNKIIKFYTFEPQPSMYELSNVNHDLKIIDMLSKVFPSAGTYNFTFDKDNYFIDIHEKGANYIFGKCAKESELKYTNFYQTRNTSTNTTTPYTSVEPGSQLEVYTYFYIDCENNRMAVILHKNISKIHTLLSEYIYIKSENMINIYITPEKIPDIRKAAKNLKRAKSLELSFAKGYSKKNIESLTKSLGDFEFDSYTINFKLSQANDGIIEKLYLLSNAANDNINGIKLIGKNDYGLDETINFLETVYTKNIPFNLTEDIANNTEYIKNKLHEALSM